MALAPTNLGIIRCVRDYCPQGKSSVLRTSGSKFEKRRPCMHPHVRLAGLPARYLYRYAKSSPPLMAARAKPEVLQAHETDTASSLLISDCLMRTTTFSDLKTKNVQRDINIHFMAACCLQPELHQARHPDAMRTLAARGTAEVSA